MAGILSSHRLLPGAKLAELLASPPQIDLTCDDNDVAGRLLLLNENSMLISGLTETVTVTNVPENQDLPASQTLLDEQLAPIIEETVQELHSPIGIVDEVVQPPLVDPLLSYWKILDWMPPFCQQNSCGLVFKETSHSGNSYI